MKFESRFFDRDPPWLYLDASGTRADEEKFCYGDAVGSRASTVVGSRDPSTALRMTMPAALSFHPIERFLKNFEIAGVANFVARILNPLVLQ